MESFKIELPEIVMRNLERLAKDKDCTVDRTVEEALGIFMALHLLKPDKACEFLDLLAVGIKDEGK